MENFNQNETENSKVKEKSIYLLHLDNSRIIVLSSIIIGIIAVAFLIGMKISDSANAEEDLFNTQTLSVSSMDSTNSQMDSLFNDNSIDSKDEDTVDGSGDFLLADKEQKVEEKKSEIISEAKDVLASDNVNIVKPGDDKVVVKPTAPTRKKSTTTVKAVSGNKKSSTKPVAVKKKAANKTVVEPKRDGFAIQIASYDNISNARKEESKLKDMRYKTYIDDAYVDGIKYYRVRIGPFTKKNEGISALNSIQRIDRYRESYMVKAKE